MNNEVETYELRASDQSVANFGISKMEDIYEKHQGKVHAPHRHNYYTVLVVDKAEGEHIIDFSSFPFEARQLFFVAPGQVHQVYEKGKPKGYALTFSTAFLVQNGIPLQFIEELHLFENYGYSPPLVLPEEQFEVCSDYAEKIFELHQGDHPLKIQSIGAYLKLLLIESYAYCDLKPDERAKQSKSNSVLRSFKEKVEASYAQEHTTGFYADSLHITSDHLNRTVKSLLGKTVKEYIQARITVEAKRLLYFTDLSIKEVGYKLGFNEPANFSAFFKKCTRKSPQEFKKSIA